MIEFNYETDFKLDNETKFIDWLYRVVDSEMGTVQQIDYIFCSDSYLLEMNKKHLFHDTLTDVITFDYSSNKQIGGDIFISVDRVKDNANKFEVSFENELLRVMAHGILHLFGFKDKSPIEKKQMRTKEEEKIKLFHVEQRKSFD